MQVARVSMDGFPLLARLDLAVIGTSIVAAVSEVTVAICLGVT